MFFPPPDGCTEKQGVKEADVWRSHCRYNLAESHHPVQQLTVATRNTQRATGKNKIQSVCQCGSSCEDVDRLRLIPVLRSLFNRVFYSSSTSKSPSPTVSPGLQWTLLTWTYTIIHQSVVHWFFLTSICVFSM